MSEKVEERVLVQKFRAAKEKKDALDASLKAAKKEFEKIEAQLIGILEANSAEASGRYDGVGYVRMMKPRLYANCNVGDMDTLFEHLKKVERTDLIKTTVPAPTLSSYVKECIETGQDIPECVSYYLKQSLRLYT